MTDLLGPEPHDSILEVGTGLGYQAAVLAELFRSGVERRNRGGVGRPSRSEPAPAWLLRCRHPHRRRFAWLARARALRYSPADGRRRAIASGDPRSNQTQRTDRSAAGPGRGAMAHGDDKGADGQTSTRKLIRVRFSGLETVV